MRRGPGRRVAALWCGRRATASASGSKAHFVTTPIFYVNGAPHLGHLHSALIADATHRWRRACGQPSFFLTGTDEHGLKVQLAAERAGEAPAAFTDRRSDGFRALFARFGIAHSDYVRTTQPRHRRAVEALWAALEVRGHLYRGAYRGWYSVSDEEFLAPSQVGQRPAGAGVEHYSLESGHAVVAVEEENVMFRLTAFREPLLRWLGECSPVYPAARLAEVQAFVRSGLQDLSVSRPAARIRWAIPAPNHPDQTVYVWLDALANYLTAAGYPGDTSSLWPADLHVIGKDIMRFHAVYWPAFLMAVGLPLPRRILAHAHWTVDHRKMSKSLGNVVDPAALADSHGVDAVRYFVLRDGGVGDDASFSEATLVARVNAELADSLGNLVYRVVSPTLNPERVLPAPGALDEAGRAIVARLSSLPSAVRALYDTQEFGRALELIAEVLSGVDRYYHEKRPWVLFREDRVRCATVLYVAAEAARLAALLLQPVIPDSAERILGMLGVPPDERGLADIAYGRNPGTAFGEKTPLFSKLKIGT